MRALKPNINPGQRFGRLTVLRDTHLRRDRNVVWACRCDCGKQKFVTTHALRMGCTRSCGCLHDDTFAAIPQKGESNAQSKLTADDVLSIRATYATGEWTQKELAAIYSVWQPCISKIVLGQRWQHI